MTWLPSFEWLTGLLSLNVLLIVLTFGTAVITFLWQHNEDLKNPRSTKSLIIIGTCLLAGVVSIFNAMQQDRDSADKDQQLGYLTSEITGYKTAILSQAIRANDTPVHAMFVFHPKGVDYNRGLKDIDFERDDPKIKPFFYHPIFANGRMDIDINTLFRYELGWSVENGKSGLAISFGGARKNIWDRMGFNAYAFSAQCDYLESCSLKVDPDGDDNEPDEKEVSSDGNELEGNFVGLSGNPDGIFAVSLKRDVTWSDIVRAVGAPFASSWYGKGSYGAMRFSGIDGGKLEALKAALAFQDLYFGFEFLSRDQKSPGCLMARLPVRLEFIEFEKAVDSFEKDEIVYKKTDVAIFEMKPGSPSIEIVDCADHGAIG